MGKKTPEGLVKSEISDFLNGFGPDVWYYMPVQTGYGKRAHDYVVCFYGLFISIEAKSLRTEHGRRGLTDLQAVTAREISKAHGIVLVVNEDTMADIFVYLAELALTRKPR